VTAVTENDEPKFAGFPAGAHATAIPNVFFSELLPKLRDPDELRVILYAFFAMSRRRGYPRFVTAAELAAEAPLAAALGGDSEIRDRLERALTAAVDRGALITLEVGDNGKEGLAFLLNTPSSRRAAAAIEKGRLRPGRQPEPPSEAAGERENIYRLYEDNIGPLTPMVAQELKEAEGLYPVEWIREAFREAAVLNHRSWRYAARILERWATEGRKREEAGRDPGAGETARAQISRRFDKLAGR